MGVVAIPRPAVGPLELGPQRSVHDSQIPVKRRLLGPCSRLHTGSANLLDRAQGADGVALLHFSHTNIHAARKNSCAAIGVNDRMDSLVIEKTTSLTKLMNRTQRAQPTLVMGFAAQGNGLSRYVCMTIVEPLTPSQAGAAATK
jgi:hypothetical protein